MIRRLTEPSLFAALALLNMLPFILLSYFPSMDGPSHLSNAFIIKELLLSDNPFLESFYRFNPEPVPNWTGHALLAGLMTLLSPALSEKILLALLLLGIPYSFRSLMRAVSDRTPWLSWLIFPFAQSIFLVYGFYNFCISIILFFYTLSFWVRTAEMKHQYIRMMLLALLLLLTYFSHILTFGLLGIALFLHIILTGKSNTGPGQTNYPLWFRSVLGKSLLLLAAGMIPLILSFFFFSGRVGPGEAGYLSIPVILDKFIYLAPLTSLDVVAERKSIRFLALAIGLLVLTAMIGAIRKRSLWRNFPAGLWITSTFLFFSTLCFVMPDSLGTGSYITDRICYFSILVLILLLSATHIREWIMIGAAVAGIGISYKHSYTLFDKFGYYQTLAAACHTAGQKILPGSFVLPVNMLTGHQTGHFADYAAMEKPVAMAYNYECTQGYFPLVWNDESRPNYWVGDTLRKQTHYLKGEETGRGGLRKTDYVLLLGSFDPGWGYFYETLDRILNDHSELVYSSGACRLYRIR